MDKTVIYPCFEIWKSSRGFYDKPCYRLRIVLDKGEGNRNFIWLGERSTRLRARDKVRYIAEKLRLDLLCYDLPALKKEER